MYKKTTNEKLLYLSCFQEYTFFLSLQNGNKEEIQCRWDYHQTGSFVVVSIYAKQYCPTKSIIKLNPIRLHANLIFPQESNGAFNLDIELKGVSTK